MKPETMERRRARVLDAAARLFASEDYGRVHMDDVAIAADIAKPTLYRYFATKEMLFMAALERTLGRLNARAAELGTGSGSAETRLRRMIALIHDEIGALAPALRAIEGVGSEPGEHSRKALRHGMRSLREAVVAAIDEGTRRGEFDVDDSELAAVAILGAVRMTAMMGNGSGANARRLSELLLRGLARRGSARPTLNIVGSSLALGEAS